MSLTSSPSSLLITCTYHLNLASLTFSAMSSTPHLLLISLFHVVSNQLSFILLITCPYHRRLCAISNTPHPLPISTFPVFSTIASLQVEETSCESRAKIELSEEPESPDVSTQHSEAITTTAGKHCNFKYVVFKQTVHVTEAKL